MATLPSAFYAYPSQPLDLTETIETAIKELAQTNVADVRSWRSLNISGRIIIDEILRAIDDADAFACDLTYLNLNVLFELNPSMVELQGSGAGR